MKSVILEYASSAIAVFGTLLFFNLLGPFFLGKEGALAVIICQVLGGI